MGSKPEQISAAETERMMKVQEVILRAMAGSLKWHGLHLATGLRRSRKCEAEHGRSDIKGTLHEISLRQPGIGSPPFPVSPSGGKRGAPPPPLRSGSGKAPAPSGTLISVLGRSGRKTSFSWGLRAPKPHAA